MVEPHADAQLLYPDTLADDPVAVQINVDAPVVDIKPPDVMSPLHNNSSPDVEPTGFGFTVMVDKKVFPVHPAVEVGVTVYLT